MPQAAQHYIVAIEAYNGDETSIELFTYDGEEGTKIAETLYSIVKIDGTGAHLIDNGYETIHAIKCAWPEAIGPE